MSTEQQHSLDDRLKAIGSGGVLDLHEHELCDVAAAGELHDQLDDYFDARFAEPVPGSTPITYPPPAPVDVEALDRYLAELVHGGARHR